jgi:CRP/FNR family transcriptional regulator, cyclic AMP receptor protein
MRKVLFVLGQLSDTDVDWLANNGTRERIAKGTMLIKSGTRIEDLYIVLDGNMAVLAPNGALLGHVASGDILGEMSFIEAGKTSASIRVEEDSRVLKLSGRAVTRKLTEDVQFAARFYRALAVFLADRMRNTIRNLGFGSVDDDSEESQSEIDELDANVLDNLHLAGARFERMLKKLSG